ncbi:T9SS type A sorting domain-containing protein [Chryseobacterium sp. 22458]|uniref:T9SS type A sorting domain-containing protein n=1 Tax=Chryseobacterium sp. 22458 TaxID=3453921 RepID=UPI003F87818D
MINRFLFLAIISFSILSVKAQNQFLDPTFGTNGVVTYTPGNTTNFNYETGIVTSQNKIVVSGSYYPTSTSGQDITTVVQRLNADGTLDNTFNALAIPPPLVINSIRFLRMNIQADQKILLGDIFGRRLIRLHENGTYDTGFGNNGVVDTHIYDSYFSPNGISAFKLSNIFPTNDNKILLCIKVIINQESQYMITRLNENGSVDTSFGNNGLLLHVAEYGNLALQNDSKIIFIGQKADKTYMKFRYTGDGTLDTSYNNSVLQYTPLVDHTSTLFNVVGKDNNTYIYSISPSTNSFTAFITLMKLNQNGDFDSSFGTNGIVHEPYYSNNNNYLIDTNLHYPTLLLDNNNNIFVVNTVSSTGNSADMNLFVKKFKPNGTVDTGFGNNGLAEIDLNYREVMRSAIITPDQKIMVFGNYQTPVKGLITKILNNTNALSVKEERSKIESVSIYPNPVKNILHINSGQTKDLNVEITDAAGRSILKTGIKDNKLNVNELQKGIYYLKMGNTSHKFIKE